jgi:hypothetical protein
MIKLKSLLKNPKYKSMHTYEESTLQTELNDTLEWRYWWMDPNLKFHPVEHEGHTGFALRYLSQKNIDYRMTGYKGHYEEMFQLGWIRLGLAPYQGKYILGYNYSPTKPPTSRQKKAIKDFAIEIEADEIRDNTAGKWEYIDESLEYPIAKGKDIQAYVNAINWKGKITWMSPDKFLKLAAPLPDNCINQQSIEKLEKRLKEQLPTDFLVLEVDMIKRKVTGHEGRHRAIVAKKLGIEKVPVLIYTGSGFHRFPDWDKDTHDVIDKADFKSEK